MAVRCNLLKNKCNQPQVLTGNDLMFFSKILLCDLIMYFYDREKFICTCLEQILQTCLHFIPALISHHDLGSSEILLELCC